MNEYLHKIRQIIVLRRKTMTLTPRTDFGEAQRLYFMPWLNRCSCFIKPHFFERRSDTAAAMSNPAPSEMRMTAGMKNWAFLTRRATQPKPAQIRITPARIEGSERHNYRNQNVFQPVRRRWQRTGRLLEKKSDRSAKSTQAHLIPPFSSYDAFDGTEVNKKFRQIADMTRATRCSIRKSERTWQKKHDQFVN